MQSEPRQYVDIFLPYYFKIGTLFSEDFLYYAIDAVEKGNELPMMILRDTPKIGEMSVRCARDPHTCHFRLNFIQQAGEEGEIGYRLIDTAPVHYCQPMFEERRELTYRKQLIRFMRQDICKIIHHQRSRSASQSTKVLSAPMQAIMGQLALQFDQFPNFLFRGLSRQTQAHVRRYFDKQLARLRRLVDRQNSSSNDLQSMLMEMDEIEVVEPSEESITSEQ